MNWVPILFLTFKGLVFGTGMFFAIKWHYEQDAQERRGMLLAGGKVAVIFVCSLLCLGGVTFAIARGLGLELSLH